MRRVGALLLLLGVAATVLSSCGPARADALHVERVITGTGVGRFDPFDRTVVDAAKVAALHDLVVALPTVRPGNDAFCPASWGLGYRLTFGRAGGGSGGATTLEVRDTISVEADGCRYAYLTPLDRRQTTDPFWAQLAAALDIYTRGNDLFPLPRDLQRP